MANSKGAGLIIGFTVLALGASAFFIIKGLSKPKPPVTPPVPVKKKLVGVIGDIPDPEIVKGGFMDILNDILKPIPFKPQEIKKITPQAQELKIIPRGNKTNGDLSTIIFGL